jgi:hypothetical protein
MRQNRLFQEILTRVAVDSAVKTLPEVSSRQDAGSSNLTALLGRVEVFRHLLVICKHHIAKSRLIAFEDSMRFGRRLSLACVASLAFVPAWAPAQPPAAPMTGAAAKPGDAKEAVIDRVPLVLRDPLTYQVPLHLDPIRTLTLSAPNDSSVTSILSKIGDQVAAQAEVVRFDNKLLQLQVTRAQAGLRAAESEAKAATGPSKDAAEARAQVAKAEFDIAELKAQQGSVKSPFAGRVIKILVTEGEVVRAGQPVAVIIDSSQLVVQVPVDRKANKVGDSIDIKVEDQAAQVKLTAILPLVPEMDRIRELFLAAATGRGVIDNASNKYQAGQTVYSAMIPRAPVAEVSTATLGNSESGGRKIQVIRDGIVRDIAVTLLGQIGDDRVFVTGDFSPKDELITKSSMPLVDGNRLTPRGGGAVAVGRATPGAVQPGAAPSAILPMPTAQPKPSSDF